MARLKTGDVAVRLPLVLTALLAAAPVFAQEGAADCMLEIEGKTLIDGSCWFQPVSRSAGLAPGSFIIKGVDANRGGYSALVAFAGRGRGMAFWSGSSGTSPPDIPAGVVYAEGACWKGPDALVCAWKPGERRRLQQQAQRAAPAPSANERPAPPDTELRAAGRQMEEALKDPTKRRVVECLGVKVYQDPQPQGSPPGKAECDALADRLGLPKFQP